MQKKKKNDNFVVLEIYKEVKGVGRGSLKDDLVVELLIYMVSAGPFEGKHGPQLFPTPPRFVVYFSIPQSKNDPEN
jgi:hypothetical protein